MPEKRKKQVREKAPRSRKEPGGLSANSRQDKAKDTPSLPKGRGEVKLEMLPEDYPLLKSVFNFYVEEWKREHPGDKMPREWFYVSDVGWRGKDPFKCPRAIYYQFYNPEAKKDMAASTIMNIKLGNIFHEELQRVLRNLGHTTNKHVEFGTWSKVGFMKRGRIDVLLTHLEVVEAGKPVVVPSMLVVGEIKSKNPYAFEGEPGDDEIDQALSYVHDCMNDPYFRDRNVANFCLIIYVDRGGLASPPIRIWRAWYSEERIKAIEAEFLWLHWCIINKNIPERPYEMDSLACTYCRFRESICWLGFERPEAPVPEPDKSIEPPSQEIVESMASAYIRLKAEISDKEGELELARKVLKAYFRSTGKMEVAVGDGKIQRALSNKFELDNEFLWREIQDKWILFAVPGVELLRKAVKDGLVDATVFEKAKKWKDKDGKPLVSESLRIVKSKKKEE